MEPISYEDKCIAKIGGNVMNKCHNLALDLATDNTHASYRKLYSHLRYMLKKNGPNPNILGSLGDILKYNRPAIRILKKAYALALETEDVKNLTFISDSIANRYLCINDRDLFLYWIEKTVCHLEKYYDSEICENILHELYIFENIFSFEQIKKLDIIKNLIFKIKQNIATSQ